MPPSTLYVAIVSPSMAVGIGGVIGIALIVCIVALSVLMCGGKKDDDKPPPPNPTDDQPPPAQEAPKESESQPETPADAPPAEQEAPKSEKKMEKSQVASGSIMMKEAGDLQLMSKIGNVSGIAAPGMAKKGGNLPSLRLMDQSQIGAKTKKSAPMATGKSVSMASGMGSRSTAPSVKSVSAAPSSTKKK